MGFKLNPLSGQLDLTGSGGGGAPVTSVNGQVGDVILDTDDVNEGATNQYFTDERAQDAVGVIVDDSTKVSLTYSDATPSIVADIVPNSLTNTDINSSAGIDVTKLADGSVTNIEFQTLAGITSTIQDQLDGKANTNLNNLFLTAINSTLRPDSVSGIDVGDDSFFFDTMRAQSFRSSVTQTSFTADTSNGDPVLIVADTTGLVVGHEVIGTGIPAGSYIDSIDPDVSVTLNQNATANNSGISLTALWSFQARSADHESGTNQSGRLVIRSGNTVNANTGKAIFKSGDVTSGSGVSGDVQLTSGSADDASGALALSTGQSNTLDSGQLDVFSGPATLGASGAVNVFSSPSTLQSGDANLNTGNSSTDNSGFVVLKTGNAANNSGDILLFTGSAGGTAGSVKMSAESFIILNRKSIQLLDVTNTSSIGLQAPASIGSSVTYILPEDGTDGQVLTTDGAGNLSWITATVPGDIPETSASLANNQSTPVNVTGFLIDSAFFRSFNAQVVVSIEASISTFEIFELKGVQREADWVMSSESTGDDSGIVFSITPAGQIQYISSNNIAFIAGTFKFRAEVLSI